MDMREPYHEKLRAYVPDSEQTILFDAFRVMQIVNTAVDAVRKLEHRTLAAAGASKLTRSSYAGLRNPASFSATVCREFAALRARMPQTAKACGRVCDTHGASHM
jgi:hypothetical protein